MKQIRILIPAGFSAVVLILLAATQPVSAQEDLLKQAEAMNERRMKGLQDLAEKIKNFGFLKIGQNVLGKLDSREQAEDPFGMAMDPENALPETEVAEEVVPDGEEEVVLKTSLEEALTKLSITGAFPDRKQIMIGAQELGVGDDIVIDYKETVFTLRIMQITSSELTLKDQETQEVGKLAIGFSGALPAGMTRQVPKATEEDATRQESTIVPMSSRVVKVE